MSVVTPMIFEVGAVVLGYAGNVASWRRPTQEYRQRHGPMLCIQVCATTDEGVHTPASSVTLTSRESLLALRSAIDEALNERAAAQATGAAS